MPTTDPASWQNPGVLLENNTAKALPSGSVYTGEWSNVAYFASISVFVATDVTGTLEMQFSSDKVNVDNNKYFRIFGTTRDAAHRSNVTHKWFRIVYTNDGTDQTYLRIQTIAGNQSSDLDSTFDAPNSNFQVQIPTVTDMTNRVRIANPNKVLETTWQYDLQPRSWSTRSTGGASINGPAQTDPAYARLSAGTASGDIAELRTKRFMVYQPFRTHVISMSTILGTAKANQVKRFGQYTDFNGWYFEQTIDGFYVGYRNSTFEPSGTIDTKIERSDWNVDKLDGTGPSGLDLVDRLGYDLTFIIAFVWHGTQGIKFGIQYFDKTYYVHYVIWSATSQKPFARSALLPISYELENTGAVASATNMYVGPISFNIEGGEERVGLRFSSGNGVTGVPVTSTTVPAYIFGIRPKLQFNGVNNRGTITPLTYQIFSDGDIFYEILLQAIVTNGTWTSQQATSITETSSNFTAVPTVGYRISTGYVGAAGKDSTEVSNTFESFEFLSIDTLNSNAQLALVARAYKLSNNATVRVSFSWKETY